MTELDHHRAGQDDLPGRDPVLDVVIPVYNEEATLAACVHRLDAHLRETYPYPFVITVANNASTDRTADVAFGLAEEVANLRVVDLDRKGRGRALKAAWESSTADVLAYMDVDLSTDLDALWPLVAPLMSGHSDLAIGSRLSSTSRVVRQPSREIISRGYNLLLRVGLGVGFSDAQCGFKAIRADVARELLPLVEDDAWFFDTELLVLAERAHLRIHEVPVDWMDDPDSRVDVTRTAIDDLRGMWRMRRSMRRLRPDLDRIAATLGRGVFGAPLLRQIARFAGVGIASTALHLAGFVALVSMGMAGQVANVLALAVATVANTQANRTFTFGAREEHALRHHAEGFVLAALTWLMTAVSLGAVQALVRSPDTILSTVGVAVGAALSVVIRFLAMRRWAPSEGATGGPFPGVPTVPRERGGEVVRHSG
ncbi:MAG: bifunctional glycosyltransferase family 2/GtrA family protein [Actinobacteria bacterium]|nr:bifunctional glycosyltransferase family 2/GtrA family protein [Thermoleophilia bacterium]MCB9011547.1 bifunctional glycosyltransferase family 2/GtrA family protein [Actinomycetota bacterium]